MNFANQGIRRPDGRDVARALTLLDVDQVCLPVEARKRIRFVRAHGYQPADSSASDSCLTR